MIVGEKIRERRLELGMSVRELSKRMGYANHSTLSRIERGEVDLNQSRISQFARELGTTPGHLMGWDVTPEEAGATAAKVLKNPDTFHMMQKYLKLDPADQLIIRNMVDALDAKQKKD